MNLGRYEKNGKFECLKTQNSQNYCYLFFKI